MAKISKTDRAALITELKSNDETRALAAIEKLKSSGDGSLMPEILAALSETSDVAIENGLAQVLFDLKDPDALNVLVDLLVEPRFENIRIIMLSACWQCGLDLSHRLPDLITVASTGSYLECLEVLTIIENWENIADQEVLENELLRIRAYLSESDYPEKDDMILSIIEEMEKFITQ